MKYFLSLLLIINLNSQVLKWGDIPTKSENAKKSSLQLEHRDGLGALYNFKILNGSRAVYDNNDDVQTITTRQIANASDFYEKNVKSVVLICAGNSIGAGAILNSQEIITNLHVVEGLQEVDIVLYDSDVTSLNQINNKKIFKAEVIAIDKKRDLALLKTSKYLSNYIKVGANWKIKVAQDVFAIGHPEGLWSFTDGVISSLPKPKEWSYNESTHLTANCIQTQTPINPGNSGGPLFNDNGEMIGVNSWGKSGKQGLNFAVRIDEVNDFLTKAKQGYYPKGEEKKEPEWVVITDHSFEDIEELQGKDSNSDGYYDIWVIFQDKDDELDIRLFDFNFDGEVDAIHSIVDAQFIIDDDYDGTFDTLGIDTDNDWKPDKFEDYKE